MQPLWQTLQPNAFKAVLTFVVQYVEHPERFASPEAYTQLASSSEEASPLLFSSPRAQRRAPQGGLEADTLQVLFTGGLR